MSDIGELVVETLPIESINAYEKNPRIVPPSAVDALAEAIKRYRFKQPLVVDKNNVLVVGHTRLKALKKLGAQRVTVVRADELTEEQIREYRILDNKLAEKTTWDFDLLRGEMQQIDLNLDVIELTFSHLELDSILADAPEELEDAEPKRGGGPRKKTIALELEQYERFKLAADHFRRDVPDAKDADVLMALVDCFAREEGLK